MVYLRDGDSTLFGKFLFGFFTGVWVGQVGVEILIQALCCLFAEITPFAPDETQTDDKYRGFFSPFYFKLITFLSQLPYMAMPFLYTQAYMLVEYAVN